MVRYENECVGCEQPCIYEGCPYWKVERHYCDNCGEEIDDDEAYIADGYEYCEKCAQKKGLIEEDEQ